MEARDLMIGDWVQVPCLIDNTENYNAWCQIKQLRDGDLDVIGFKELSYDEIEPIPLTPEVLEKIDFEKQSEGSFAFENLEDNYWVKFFPKDTNYTCGAYNFINLDCGCIFIREMPIDFVHQLQHALRLCGIEKEIAL